MFGQYRMTPCVSPFVPQNSYFTWLIGSVRCFSFQIEVFTCCSLYADSIKKEIERLHKLLAEVEIDEDSDFDNKDNGPEDVLEKNFSDHESFSKHNKESEEDSGNGELNNLE
ncbi:hypothetical protein AVEN_167271-1 [Araneus ventricosus]|uniref:Uncharacterized protein n=1 Tax=Araneus ventricosus TaxID=182803 RepID=A0A4Y2HFZ7_ARAVE|nr:hypothetical protein AVEN_167271-1 [Araneus ventricosus]